MVGQTAVQRQPTRPLNVRSRCSHRDAIGTQTRLDLLVKEATVKTFSAQVSMKGHGTVVTGTVISGVCNLGDELR